VASVSVCYQIAETATTTTTTIIIIIIVIKNSVA
jgi:hypothetical protein